MVSFPKKSYFKQSEVLSILGMSREEFRLITKNNLKSLFSESGQKVYLREDIISLYAQSDVRESTVQPSQPKKQSHSPQLSKYRDQFQSALDLISQIKSDRSEIWNNLQ